MLTVNIPHSRKDSLNPDEFIIDKRLRLWSDLHIKVYNELFYQNENKKKYLDNLFLVIEFKNA